MIKKLFFLTTLTGLLFVGCNDFDCCKQSVIQVTSQMIELTNKGDYDSFDVTSPLPWTLTNLADTPPWLDIDVAGNTIHVTIMTPNFTSGVRTFDLIFLAANGDTTTVTVKQNVSAPVPVISNLTATLIASISASMDFDLNTDAVVYYLDRLSTAPAPSAADVKSLGGGGNFSAGTGITLGLGPFTPNTEYTVYMMAENANGTSSVVSVMFTTLPAVTISNPSTVINSTSIQFNFDLDVAATVYALVLPAGSPAPTLDDIKDNGVSYPCSDGSNGVVIGALTSGTMYVCYVVAENANGTSNVISFLFTTL